ncbi:MAG TPA: alkaline phosphatase family protein [Bryobacteraceae bacterium]|jgi:predicted AlkP superfamily phosphohydrolase/phosphomutase
MTHWGLFAYVGPGAGFAFLGSFLSVLLAVLAGIASLIVWPFRMAWSLLARPRRTRVRKAIFLGFDGLDPAITERLMTEGRLPNLARLRDRGSYRRLRTTFPALSPVAWSTFATGVNPAKHNIFDFLSRDLRTYLPELSSAKVWPARRILRIGKWKFPLSRAAVEMRRKGEPFWKILGTHAVTSTILRVPVTFPPEAFNGRELSAMCTPDLLGTQGTYSRFTAPEGALAGPEGTHVPFRIRGASIEIQGTSHPLRVGEYTPWIKLKFGRAHGIVRFLLNRLEPEIDLYATPVQIDPENPALPISHPAFYAIYLAKLLGTYSTLGLAEDTSALNDGAIGEEAFLRQAELTQKERESMFFSALERTRRGMVACVFDTTDRVQHMFHGRLDVIEPLYCDMDRIVGKTLTYADEKTALFVLSDHGFCAFRRGVNLNAWLLREGYLTLDSGLTSSGEYLEGIDWTKTRAYAFGLGGLYLNLRGREAHGIVMEEDTVALKDELVRKLTGLVDDEMGKTAIRSVYRATDIYRGPYLGAAPDLIIGYAEGYRASWDAATGRVTAAIFEDNRKAWRGDHCVDPPLVPGVLFSNLKMTAADPGIEDLAPTALSLFGVEPPVWMEGTPVIATT